MENWEKVPIVVPKVAFLGTFGTTIGLLANETHYHVLSRLQYNMPFFVSTLGSCYKTILKYVK